jgi:hypothetical protein
MMAGFKSTMNRYFVYFETMCIVDIYMSFIVLGVGYSPTILKHIIAERNDLQKQEINKLLMCIYTLFISFQTTT